MGSMQSVCKFGDQVSSRQMHSDRLKEHLLEVVGSATKRLDDDTEALSNSAVYRLVLLYNANCIQFHSFDHSQGLRQKCENGRFSRVDFNILNGTHWRATVFSAGGNYCQCREACPQTDSGEEKSGQRPVVACSCIFHFRR